MSKQLRVEAIKLLKDSLANKSISKGFFKEQSGNLALASIDKEGPRKITKIQKIIDAVTKKSSKIDLRRESVPVDHVSKAGAIRIHTRKQIENAQELASKIVKPQSTKKTVKNRIIDNNDEVHISQRLWGAVDHYEIELQQIEIKQLQIDEAVKEVLEHYYTLLKNYKNATFKLLKVVMTYGTMGYVSFVLRNEHITASNIKDKFNHYLTKNFNSVNYSLTLFKMDVGLMEQSTSGSCDSKEHTTTIVLDKLNKVKISSMKSTDNNCGVMCFIKHLGKNGNQIKPNAIRAEVGLKEKEPITLQQMATLAKHFNVGLIVCDENQNILIQHDLCNASICRVLLIANHYSLITETIAYKRCKDCNKILNSNNTTHKCNLGNIRFTKNKFTDEKLVYVHPIEESNVIDYNKMVYYDLETFPDSRGVHVPYACGWEIEGKYYQAYGKGCIDQFVDVLATMENKIVCAYNGSAFDHYFLLNELTDRLSEEHKIDGETMVFNNGKLMKLNFGKNNAMWDLCLFINKPLAVACDDFKITNAKTSFDHSKMKSWEDVEKYRHEVEPYLKLDVLAMSELFKKVNDAFYEASKVNITSYITLSHMAYCEWASKVKEPIEILKDEDKYKFTNLSTFGARCYPLEKEYKSRHYDDIMNGKMCYQELIKTDDFIFNADASSLYPTAMAGYELLNVKYPVGFSRWSDDPEKDFNDGKLGFYEITFTPPKNIVIPVLPRKTPNGGLEWSLKDGAGVYTNIDIQNAKSTGYNIDFVNRALVWDQSADIFGDYVKKFYSIKQQADRDKNEVQREIAKTMLNALYGKMLQKRIETTSKIVTTLLDFISFCNQYDIVDYQILAHTKVLITGQLKETKFSDNIRKPNQLGSFVLAYSRTIMLNYMKAIDPELKTHIMTYTDTDSMHIKGDAYKKLVSMGYIKQKEHATLGYLCSDIKNEGLIIKETNLGPKQYCYQYINNKNNDGSVAKCKGIPQRLLTDELYEKQQPTDLHFDSLKKINLRLLKDHKENNVRNFSIMSVEMSRTFLKTEWESMTLKDNKFYPIGYEF